MVSRALGRCSSATRALCVGLLALVALAGCGDVPAAERAVGHASARVVNGVYDVDHPAPLGDVDEAVVAISWANAAGNGFGCTGALIGPRVVLTARHCVTRCDGTATDPYGCTTDYALSGYEFSLGADTNPASALTPAIAIKLVHDGAKTLYGHDLALIELDRAIGSRVVPIRLDAPAIMGERVRAVGYGLTNDGSKLNVDGSPYRFRRDALTIVELGPDQAQGVTATELLLGESICDGDSGGPLLDETSGAILGTVSRGGNGTSFQDYRGCVDTNGNPATNVYTRVDKFAGLVTQALGDVGEVPTPEASGNAVDPDAGAPQDDAAGAPSASSAASSSGGCATAPAGGSSRLAFMLALAALFATRRRRRA